MTASAYLRVYLPVEALRAAGLELPAVGAETAGQVRMTAGVGLFRGSDRDDVLVTEWGGGSFGCPRRPMLRAMEGLLAFRRAYLGAGGEFLVPEKVARHAARQLEELEDQPLAQSYILTSAWHVPLRWFAAFEPTERELFDTDGRRSIRYRTVQSEAAARLEEVLGVLRESGMDDSVVEEVEELAEWINGYPEDSMIELDYGTVAGLFSETDLLLDESSSDIWESLTALASNDWEKATSHYVTVAMRWARPMAVAFSS